MKERRIRQHNNSNGTEIEDYVFAVTENEATSIERPLEKKRLEIFWWIILLACFVLGGRIFYLNIFMGRYYQEAAQANKIRHIIIKAPRGKIYDRYGILLVNNVPSIDLGVVPADLPKNDNDISRMASSLSEILKINEGEIIGKLSSISRRSLNPILLKESITQDELLSIIERQNEFRGLVVEKTAVRDYVDSSIFSHVLGYVGKIENKELEEKKDYSFTDYIGKQGIEKSYEKFLRGRDGALQMEVDSRGNIQKERGIIDPVPGNDLILSIDAELQKKVFDELTEVMEKTETKTAAAVAINPQNGEVLALVSLPSFDNNLFSKKISQSDYLRLIGDADKPLFNRAISGEYPPGSTLKPLIAAAGLAEGTIDQGTGLNCGGAIHVGEYRFGDWKTHGYVDVRKAIAESCDVFFYSVGGGYGGIHGLGMGKMKQYENTFGLGKVTDIDLPGEADGFIPDEGWKLEKIGEKWYIGNSYHASIGQGYITTTPLQIVNYISAIANGGSLFQPRLALQARNSIGEKKIFSSKVYNKEVAPLEIIKIVREGMRETIVSGTATSLSSLPVSAAGKTGTAQFGSENKTHAWFVSFAPYEKPEIAMVILVEGGGEGHSSAVPATKEIYNWYFTRNKKQNP